MKKNRSKFIFRLSCLIIGLLMFFGEAVPAEAANTAVTVIGREDHKFMYTSDSMPWPGAPGINADTAILVELNSGAVLYCRGEHTKMYPASLTKIATSLVVIENADLTQTLTVSDANLHFNTTGGEDSQGRFYAGQTMSFEEALYAFNLDSVNTLGAAFAETMDGSDLNFALRMNTRAAKAGALNTNFRNPHGLNDLEHMTTAYDLAKILWDAVQNDTYRKIAGTKTYSFTDGNGYAINCRHNLALLQPDSEYYDSRVVCGKTGYISDAMYTRAVYATDGKLDLICVTMHSDSTPQSYADVKALLNYGFDNFSLIDVPKFGKNGEQEGEWTVGGKSRSVIYRAGEAEVVGGAALLVPNSLAAAPWVTEIGIDAQGFHASCSKNGTVLANYPLDVELVKEDWDPESSTEVKPTKEKKTTEAEQSTTAGNTEEDPAEKGKLSAKAKLIIIAESVVLLVLLLAALFLFGQNRALRRRINRRKKISKENSARR